MCDRLLSAALILPTGNVVAINWFNVKYQESTVVDVEDVDLCCECLAGDLLALCDLLPFGSAYGNFI